MSRREPFDREPNLFPSFRWMWVRSCVSLFVVWTITVQAAIVIHIASNIFTTIVIINGSCKLGDLLLLPFLGHNILKAMN